MSETDQNYANHVLQSLTDEMVKQETELPSDVLDFNGYIWPFLNAGNVWKPSDKSESQQNRWDRKRIFSNMEQKWPKSQQADFEHQYHSFDGETNNSKFIMDLNNYEQTCAPWILEPQNSNHEYLMNQQILHNESASKCSKIPVLSPLGLRRMPTKSEQVIFPPFFKY